MNSIYNNNWMEKEWYCSARFRGCTLLVLTQGVWSTAKFDTAYWTVFLSNCLLTCDAVVCFSVWPWPKRVFKNPLLIESNQREAPLTGFKNQKQTSCFRSDFWTHLTLNATSRTHKSFSSTRSTFWILGIKSCSELQPRFKRNQSLTAHFALLTVSHHWIWSPRRLSMGQRSSAICHHLSPSFFLQIPPSDFPSSEHQCIITSDMNSSAIPITGLKAHFWYKHVKYELVSK